MNAVLERHARQGFFSNAYILAGADMRSASEFFGRFGAVETYDRAAVDIVRLLKERASVALGGSRRFYIVDADTLGWQSYPALLKMIEEPPRGHHFILCVRSVESVPDTIRSRAIIITFNAPEPGDDLLKEFRAQQGLARAAWIESCAEDPERFEVFLSECERAVRARPEADALLRRIQDARNAARGLNVGRKMCLEYITAFL